MIVYTSGGAGLPKEETTWAKLLQQKGYKTAAFGKELDCISNQCQSHYTPDHIDICLYLHSTVHFFPSGKWHLGWDGSWPGDQQQGPLGHGFDLFFGLPYTLVEGFELDLPFFTYSGWQQKDNPLHSHGMALALSFLTVMAVYNDRFGYSVFVAVGLSFLVAWFFLEHFTLHMPNW